MRIQHNIMAMNAYRNYNTNTSALSKNLEKLSSGYKINRAGDDAAGLAISEKMRAQITGLEAAQKNVKDGISLVKTAEGAMQEIQDMLNRMDYLATQSANGTYQDDVDREALQQEVDALRTEINRIADSANFNGIKLLDGSLDTSGAPAVAAKEGNFEIPGTGKLQADLGVKTITHVSAVDAKEVSFGVEFGDLEFSNQTGESMTIKLDDTHSITLDAGKINSVAAGTTVKASDVVTALEGATAAGGTTGITLSDGITINGAGDWTIGGAAFEVAANEAGTGLIFTQKAGDTVEFDGDMKVDITASGTEEIVPGTVTTDITTKGPVAAAGSGTTPTTYTYDFTGPNDLTAGSYTVGIAGKTVTVTLEDGKTTEADLAKAVADAFNADASNAIKDGISADSVYTVEANGKTVVFTSSGNADTTGSAVSGNSSIAAATAKDEGGVKGTYNSQTTNTSPSAAGAAKNLASTVITLTKDHFADGSKIIFGETEYEVSADEADKDSTTKVYVGDLDVSTEDGLKAAIDRLSVVAADNEVWTVGHAGEGGKVTVTEKADADGKGWLDQDAGNKKKFDLTTVDGIKKSLGFKTAGTAAEPADESKALNLQIGDDSEDYNQMKISIGNMHTNAMGSEDGTIADISIKNSSDAQDAVDVIKGAINYVSSVRGQLGAYQNRLEHTQNNLSVMAENIQDAESTIRDTDVAEEMMSYVKNNILVQSAQAMLAQANQVPQGVLQLLG